MSDPTQLSEICKGVYTLNVISPQTSQWLQQASGALLAIVGGFSAVLARLQLEKKQEIQYIKMSLIDELNEICSIIDKMIETYTTTKIIPATYFNALQENRESFDRHKPRLFLIGTASLRKGISDFYKKMTIETAKASAIVGSLKEDDTQSTSGVASAFEKIKEDARTLEGQIKAYKFRPFYII